MLTLSLAIILAGVGLLTGIAAGREMMRIGQRAAVEWQVTQGHTTMAQRQRRSAIPLLIGVLLGVIVLPRLPASLIALFALPFAAGMTLTVLVSMVQKFLPLR